MKLRIAGNSVRLRVTRSEVAKLMDCGRIESKIQFTSDNGSELIYALERRPDIPTPKLRFQSPEVAILIPAEEVRAWAENDQVGIYTTVERGACGPLELIVEKDFACLDLSDAENADTFPNPRACAPGEKA
jgi:hypothetical protein